MAPSSPPHGCAGLSSSIPVSLSPFFLFFLSLRLTIFRSVTLFLALTRSYLASIAVVQSRSRRMLSAVTAVSDVAFHFLGSSLVSNQLDRQLYNYQFLCFMRLLKFYFHFSLSLSLSVFVYIIRLLLFNSMFNVSGHGQMAIVSLCRFVTVVAVQQRPDRTESGAGREAIQPIPLPPIASSCVECFDCKKLDSFSFCVSLILRL